MEGLAKARDNGSGSWDARADGGWAGVPALQFFLAAAVRSSSRREGRCGDVSLYRYGFFPSFLLLQSIGCRLYICFSILRSIETCRQIKYKSLRNPKAGYVYIRRTKKESEVGLVFFFCCWVRLSYSDSPERRHSAMLVPEESIDVQPGPPHPLALHPLTHPPPPGKPGQQILQTTGESAAAGASSNNMHYSEGGSGVSVPSLPLPLPPAGFAAGTRSVSASSPSNGGVGGGFDDAGEAVPVSSGAGIADSGGGGGGGSGGKPVQLMAFAELERRCADYCGVVFMSAVLALYRSDE